MMVADVTNAEQLATRSALASKPVLFVGNGPYRNRGCEAIVRGTMEILSQTFGDDVTARAGVMAHPATAAVQQDNEIDPRVKNFAVSHVGPRLGVKWWMAQANARLHADFSGHVRDLYQPAQGVACALQLGGDNFSLDYGNLRDYVAMNIALQRFGVPVFIWGASVGPFEKEPETARKAYAHLKTVTGIFVRETATQSYLERNGVSENVHLVADPAFVMKKTEVAPDLQGLVSDETIGINISPLVARFAGARGLDDWREKAAAMIMACRARTKRPILLIPHVASPKPDEDDYSFMDSLAQKVRTSGVTVQVAPALPAAQLKWLIGRCTAFAGARTHSTIAALSSQVPTLSLSYSVKAMGINQDIFGHQEFCQSVKTITPDDFAAIMSRMIEQGGEIRAGLKHSIPKMQRRALSAGPLLASLLDSQPS